MKIIHCADLHLDSKLTSVLGKEKAAERKNELLNAFTRMVFYAAQAGVKAVLIAGDMFDVKNISKKTKNVVLDTLRANPEINFYYLKGNHDKNNFLEGEEAVPENLKMFTRTWTSYDEGNICISAAELDAENAGGIYDGLVPDPKRFNIVMLHGQEVKAKGSKEINIEIKKLKNKGIDYLALGHVHEYKRKQLDGRGIYCYSGCLEGRGFDECGRHGFVMLDIDEESGKFTDEFIPFAKRSIYEVTADVSGLETSMQMADAAAEALKEAGCNSKDMVKIVLAGAVSADAEKDPELINTFFEDKYYLARTEDKTTIRVNEADYMYDESLKGEFVRLVMADEELSDEDKGTVISYGLKALAGEEI